MEEKTITVIDIHISEVELDLQRMFEAITDLMMIFRQVTQTL